MTRRLRLAWFSSNHLQSIGRHVSDMHVNSLRECADLFRFSDDHHIDFSREEIPFGRAYEIHRQEPFDLAVFCLERHPSSDFVWAMIGVFPGVSILLEDQAPAAKPWLFQSGYKETIAIRSGEVQTPNLEDLEPVLIDAEDRALQLSHAVVLGSEELLERIPIRWHSKCSVLPIPVASPIIDTTPPPKAILIGVPPTEDFAFSKILSALRQCATRCRVTWLVDDDSQKKLLEDRFTQNDLCEFELVTPKRCLESWQQALVRGGIAILLQTWGRQSLEPYLGLALVSGTPTIVSNFGLGRLLNDQFVLRLDIGLSLTRQLTTTLETILQSPNAWSGDQQRIWAESRYALNQNRGELRNFLIKMAGEVAPAFQRSFTAQRITRTALRETVWTRDIAPWVFGDAFRESREFLESL